ncbi:DUF488 domain-containing protein [Curtobacterium flaccumfaciens]|nr:DUF488 domain-containing protein [Curtobacterium flaccumfaciens]
MTGVGYEGTDLDSFLALLRLRGVGRVVDVRLNPLSRKPGFSKTRLREALAAEGIDYTHLRALGNPKDNRAGFSTTHGEQAQTSRAAYVEVLKSNEGRAALEIVQMFAIDEHVALLCFEADDCHCHRELVLRELSADRLIAA